MQPLLTSEPTHVGDYRFLARIGRGSMGGVYLARSRGGRVVAVKMVRADLADDPEFRERFRREVMMARSVGGFWTAAVVDADPDAEQPWLATEYVPGPTLHRAVADHGPLPEHTVRGLAAGLAEALSAVHRAGLVHRDLKPANVLLGPDGPRVIDFGISRAMRASTLTATGAFLGTPGFFSPEQTLGHEVGPPSDVFSLAAVLVFAASGNGPFGNENTAAMLYRAAHAEADLSRVPDALRPLLARCLAKEPEQRLTTAQLLDDLGDAHPQGDTWLPPAITAVISEHTTQLHQTTASADSGPPPVPSPAPQAPSPQSPNAGRPGTQVYTSAQPQPLGSSPAAPASPVAPVAPASPPAAPPRSAGSAAPPRPAAASSPDVERTNEIKPARQRNTQQQPVASVRKNEPGPVFRTGGRFTAFVMAALLAVVIYGAVTLALRYSLTEAQANIFNIGIALLEAAAGLFLLKALCPKLRLKINSDGLLVSRAWLSQEIPWRQVRRVGITGRGAKQAVALWCVDDTATPRSTVWHPMRRYHGGVRLFPLGATGGWWTRRQEAKRLRLALEQYARNNYDGRLL